MQTELLGLRNIVYIVGKRILNVCPKDKSCGTYTPLWTDADAPMIVGQIHTVDAYGVYDGDCKYAKLKVQTMRCT